MHKVTKKCKTQQLIHDHYERLMQMHEQFLLAENHFDDTETAELSVTCGREYKVNKI